MAPITIHHLQVSQSERLPWLCEELGIKYHLVHYKRSPILAPPEYKALHPQGTAPIIEDGDLVLAESGACIEYICRKHGEPGRQLFLAPDHPAYADFLYWWYWGLGTFGPTVTRRMALQTINVGPDDLMAKIANQRFEGGLKALDQRLAGNDWLAGSEFTVADIMVVFNLTTMRYFCTYSLDRYGNILRYLRRVGARKAYQEAMSRSDPEMVLPLGAEPPKRFVGP